MEENDKESGIVTYYNVMQSSAAHIVLMYFTRLHGPYIIAELRSEAATYLPSLLQA